MTYNVDAHFKALMQERETMKRFRVPDPCILGPDVSVALMQRYNEIQDDYLLDFCRGYYFDIERVTPHPSDDIIEDHIAENRDDWLKEAREALQQERARDKAARV